MLHEDHSGNILLNSLNNFLYSLSEIPSIRLLQSPTLSITQGFVHYFGTTCCHWAVAIRFSVQMSIISHYVLHCSGANILFAGDAQFEHVSKVTIPFQKYNIEDCLTKVRKPASPSLMGKPVFILWIAVKSGMVWPICDSLNCTRAC